MSTSLFLHISVSLDGRIADDKGSLDWMSQDAEFHSHIGSMLGSISGMVFGRTAHAELARFWPKAGEADDPDIRAEAEPMNRLPKYVLTHGALSTAWANSRSVTLAELGQLRSGSAAPIAVFAGAGAAQTVLKAGLLDEITLLRHPVLLGKGKPLFDEDTHRELTLKEARRFASGVVLERYKVSDKPVAERAAVARAEVASANDQAAVPM